jgi:uridine phosphorylase
MCDADEELVERIGYDMIRGVTISAIGFYGPQGRHVRLPLSDPDLNAKIESFRYRTTPSPIMKWRAGHCGLAR